MGNADYTTQRRMSTLHRFFVPTEWIQGDAARIESHVALQIFKVLRLSPKDRVLTSAASHAPVPDAGKITTGMLV